MLIKKWLLLGIVALLPVHHAHAFFFYLQVPKLSKPAALQAVIDGLEKAEGSKAVAFVMEDKVMGAKQWVWGQASGSMPQEEANATALQACETELAKLRQQTIDGKPAYNFGLKKCELHPFASDAKAVTQK